MKDRPFRDFWMISGRALAVHKRLGKLIIILGFILAISACTSSISKSLTLNTTRFANLILAIPTCTNCHPPIPGNLTLLDNQARETNITIAELYTNHIAHEDDLQFCATCHNSQLANYSNLTADDNEQSIRLVGHSGQIVECEVCHRQQPVHAFLLLRGEN